MAYTPEFVAKIATKPEWLSPNEKARTYATKEGWMYKDATPGARPELLVAIPGLSDIIDRDTTGNVNAANSVELLFEPTNVGFTRKSRRRYALNIGLHESVTVKPGATVTFSLDINGVNTAAANSAGGDITADLSPATLLTQTFTSNTTFGKIQFDLPELTSTPSSLKIQLGSPSSLAISLGAVTDLVDSENIPMATMTTTAIDGLDINIVG